MAIEVYETPESRRWNGDNFELRLKVEGTDSDSDARWAVLARTPVLWSGRIRQRPTIEPDGLDTWDATVTYQPNDKSPEIGDCSLSWQTGGGTQKITQAISTVGKYAPPGKTAPNNHGAIGARQDGSVEGVDILVPDFRWSERYTVNPAMLSWPYAIICAYLTRAVNDASFRGFAAGEVQFRGSSADVRLTGTAEQPEMTANIQFDFAASPNRGEFTIGDITVDGAKGWEYVDVRYEQTVDVAAVKMTPKPIAVYVHQVYPYASFSTLGIGS